MQPGAWTITSHLVWVWRLGIGLFKPKCFEHQLIGMHEERERERDRACMFSPCGAAVPMPSTSLCLASLNSRPYFSRERKRSPHGTEDKRITSFQA